MIEAANNSIIMIQSELTVQQNLVAEWIVRAINNDFSNSNLRGADLSYADLAGADLSGADLGNSNLSGADLQFFMQTCGFQPEWSDLRLPT